VEEEYARNDSLVSARGEFLLFDPQVAREPQVLRDPRIYLAGEVTPGVGRRPAKPRPTPQIGSQVSLLDPQGAGEVGSELRF